MASVRGTFQIDLIYEPSKRNPDTDLSFLMTPWEVTRESATRQQVHPNDGCRQTAFRALSSVPHKPAHWGPLGIILPSGGGALSSRFERVPSGGSPVVDDHTRLSPRLDRWVDRPSSSCNLLATGCHRFSNSDGGSPGRASRATPVPGNRKPNPGQF